MTMPLKPRVAKTITRIDRKTVAVTAGVNFEDIDLRIEGDGSEVYDYEILYIAHNAHTTYCSVNDNKTTPSTNDWMRGRGSH